MRRERIPPPPPPPPAAAAAFLGGVCCVLWDWDWDLVLLVVGLSLSFLLSFLCLGEAIGVLGLGELSWAYRSIVVNGSTVSSFPLRW